MKTKIKYVVVKIDTSGRTNEEIKRFEFDDVQEAIEKHIDESRADRECFGYWDICVEYEI